MHSRAFGKQFQNDYPRMFPGKNIKTVTFIVTHQCNLRCSYCYETHKGDKHMTLDVAKQCVDLLFAEDQKQTSVINETDAHAIIIEFIGGEPLLEIDLISNTMEYFLNRAIELNHRWQTNYMINISTNGTLGDDERVQEFIKKYDGRLSISVTIDGDKESHDACRVDCNGCGSYDRAIKMFRKVTGPDGKRYTKYTIAPGNLALFSKSVEHLVLNEGCEAIHCNCVYEKGWNLDHAKELYKQLKSLSDKIQDGRLPVYLSILDWDAGYPLSDKETNNWCGGDGQMLAFDVDGTVLPCMRFSPIATANRPVYRIGDIEHGIMGTEDDVKRMQELRSITRQSQSNTECLKCPINGGCSWCTAYNYEVTGSVNKRVTFICVTHKARVLAQCYHHNSLHLKDPEHEPKRIFVPKEWALEIIDEDEWDMLKELEAKVFEDVPNESTTSAEN